MKDKESKVNLEEICLNKVINILEKLSDKGENINVEYIVDEYMKREAGTSIA